MTLRRIDSHVYCIPPRLRDPGVQLSSLNTEILKAIHQHAEGPAVLPLASPEKILEFMKAGGVDQSVLVAFPWAELSLCRENNDFVLKSTSENPEKFFALCAIHPGDPHSLIEAERVLKAGAVGLKTNAVWQGFPLSAEFLKPYAALAEKYNAYFLIHVDQAFRHSTASAAHLYDLVKELPQAKIIAAHMGGMLGSYQMFLPVAQHLKNLYFDTAVSETLQMINFYVQAGLEDKIIFGSDFPFNHCHSQKIVVERIQELGLPENIVRKIFSENWKKLTGR